MDTKSNLSLLIVLAGLQGAAGCADPCSDDGLGQAQCHANTAMDGGSEPIDADAETGGSGATRGSDSISGTDGESETEGESGSASHSASASHTASESQSARVWLRT